MSLGIGQLFIQIGAKTEGLKRADRDVKRFTDQTQKRVSNVTKAVDALGTAFKGVITLEVGRRILRTADNFGRLTDQIRSVTIETGDFDSVFSGVKQTALETGTALNTVTEGFTRLSLVKDAVSGTNQEMLQLNDSIAKLGIISGASQDELNTALVQFSQGLAGGTFQAQELQSVLEAVPALAGEIAKGMGITLSELIALKKEGKILSEDVFKALLSRSEAINEQFSNIPIRLNRAVGILGNSFTLGVGKVEEMTEFSQTLAVNILKAGNVIKEFPVNLITAFRLFANFAQTFVEKFNFNTAILNLTDSITISFTKGLLKFQTQINAFFDAVNRTSLGIIKIPPLNTEELEASIDSLNDRIISRTKERNEELKRLSKEEFKIIEDREAALTEVVDKGSKKRVDKVKENFDILNAIRQANAIGTLQLEEANFTAREQAAAQSFANQIGMAAQHSKTFFAINKALALSTALLRAPQAVLDGYVAGNAIGGPIVGGIFAAASGAAVATQIAAISSAQFVGGKANGGTFGPNQAFRINEREPEVLSIGGRDFMMSGDSRGQVTPVSQLPGGASKVNVTLNVFTPEGQTAQATQTRSPNGDLTLDVILEAVDKNQAAGLAQGTSQTSKALASTFSLNRASGSRF